MATRSSRAIGVGVVSTYPPRACGIATFTRDLVAALTELLPPLHAQIAAINGAGETYAYPPSVALQLDESDPASYVIAAERLNRMSNVDVVSLQHDFGKFGVWRDCFEVDYIAPMLATLQKPVVVTLHSVPQAPNTLMRRTLQEVGQQAQAIVVMATAARELLRDSYQLDADALARVVHIPHGVPAGATRGLPAETLKQVLGIAGRRVLSTFGLLSAGKGIEYVIQAMPELAARHPDLLYIVIGQTHPEVRKLEGEHYREGLTALARRLGVEEHVQFVDRFLPQDALLRYLRASDVYVTPYVARDQITSGTLAYALAAGKAIVSTPYRYAQELLADGRGLFAEFEDPGSLGRAISLLLDQKDLRQQLGARAARYGRDMAWDRVATRYRDLFDAVRVRMLALPMPRPSLTPDGASMSGSSTTGTQCYALRGQF